MQIYSKTDKGLKRETNQDGFFAAELAENIAFAIVCDGMGGANAGNIASETAIKTISDYVLHSFRVNMDNIAIGKLLKNALESANIEIYDMALKNKDLKGMGTTAVAALLNGDQAVIAHVGDSRAYIAGDELVSLTRDHSIVQSLIESGKITAEDAKVHPRKNVITRALGAEESVMPEIGEFTLKDNECILLCSDGLWGYVPENDILNTLSSETNDVAEKLITLANDSGGGDNITVVILKP